MNRNQHGFTLIEIAVVTAIIGILAMIVTPSFIQVLEAKRLDAERASLATFKDDIIRSFQNSAIQPSASPQASPWTRNIAAFSSSMPASEASLATTWGCYQPPNLAVDSAWYVKLARMRGISPVYPPAPVTADQQKSLFDLAYNSYGQPRILLAGPPNEPGQQRYLLLSIMAPDSKGLALPSSDGTATWFNAIWDNNWDNEGGAPPTYWSDPTYLSTLSGAEQTAITHWNIGPGSTTSCHLLVVERILQPKYTITINNTHTSYHGWVDLPGQVAPTESLPSSPPVTIPDILAGTQVIFRRGTASPGTEAYRIKLSDNTLFSVQP